MQIVLPDHTNTANSTNTAKITTDGVVNGDDLKSAVQAQWADEVHHSPENNQVHDKETTPSLATEDHGANTPGQYRTSSAQHLTNREAKW